MSTYGTDDLVPLFGQQPPGGVGYRKGIIRSWNKTDATNTVEIDNGVLVDNLAILNTNNDALQLAAGDVVGILTTGVAASSWMILGRLTIPGTPAAESLMSQVSSRITAATNDGEGTLTAPQPVYTDLAGTGVGPSVTATITNGKALVLFGFETAWGAPVPEGLGAYASVAVSGATTIAADQKWGVGHDVNPVNEAETFTAAKFHLFTGLNPGAHTFTMKYRMYTVSGTGTPTVWFREREIAVFAL